MCLQCEQAQWLMVCICQWLFTGQSNRTTGADAHPGSDLRLRLLSQSHHKLIRPILLLSSQGKSFVKDALRCMALGLRQRFSCVSRRCSAVKEMVFSLQRECYSKHQLCLALRDHMDTMGNLIQFHLMFPPGWGKHAWINSQQALQILFDTS